MQAAACLRKDDRSGRGEANDQRADDHGQRDDQQHRGGADDVDDPLRHEAVGDSRRGAIDEQRLPRELVELHVGEERLNEVGGNPRLDALGFAGQQRLAHLRQDRLVQAEDHDVDHLVVQRVDEALEAFPAQVKLGANLEVLPRLREEAVLPRLAVLLHAAKQNVLAQVHARAALLKPEQKDHTAQAQQDGGECEKEAERRAADVDLRNAQHGDAGEDRHQHDQQRQDNAPDLARKFAQRARLVDAHVLQGERPQRQRQRDHPVAIIELRRQRVIAQPVDPVEQVKAQRMARPERRADQRGVDQLQELLIEIMLAG